VCDEIALIDVFLPGELMRSFVWPQQGQPFEDISILTAYTGSQWAGRGSVKRRRESPHQVSSQHDQNKKNG
jgi:hypothetical protein